MPSVQIHVESDFYEPLAPEGEWVVIGNSGRCWRPGHVARDWRPYCNGYWQRTDAGWYWASDEPWAWATYHYGRWDFTDDYGWYWVPQTQWAPAWVSWHSGGGYIGWAPLQSSARIGAGGLIQVNVGLIAPRAFVFVEERHFMQPVRPTTVVVNNTTIINKTVNITNIKVVNNTVINEGPRTTIIERASGQKIQSVPVHELRRQQEAPVVARQRIAAPVAENRVQPPLRNDAPPRPLQAVSPLDQRPIAKPALITHDPAAPAAERKQVEPPRVRPIPVPGQPRLQEKPAPDKGPNKRIEEPRERPERSAEEPRRKI
jgi:hypothetical protein